jgi:hypothetical protein
MGAASALQGSGTVCHCEEPRQGRGDFRARSATIGQAIQLDEFGNASLGGGRSSPSTWLGTLSRPKGRCAAISARREPSPPALRKAQGYGGQAGSFCWPAFARGYGTAGQQNKPSAVAPNELPSSPSGL